MNGNNTDTSRLPEHSRSTTKHDSRSTSVDRSILTSSDTSVGNSTSDGIIYPSAKEILHSITDSDEFQQTVGKAWNENYSKNSKEHFRKSQWQIRQAKQQAPSPTTCWWKYTSYCGPESISFYWPGTALPIFTSGENTLFNIWTGRICLYRRPYSLSRERLT